MITNVDIILSEEEIEYLRSQETLNKYFSDMTMFRKKPRGNKYVLTVSRAICREIRELLIDCVAMDGFDENYELTKEGVIIERLIDRFFIL